MHEHILPAALGLDEAIAFGRIKPLHGSGRLKVLQEGKRPNYPAHSGVCGNQNCFALCRSDAFWPQALASPVRSVRSGAAARAINPLSSRDSMRRPTSLAI